MKLIDLDNRWLLRGLIIGEAEGEPFLGKVAVGCVVRNRVNDPTRWGSTFKDVILQPKQFSCFNNIDGNKTIPITWVHRYFIVYRNYLWWRECDLAAWAILNDYVGDVTDGATHYFNPNIINKPSWAEGHEPMCEIAHHEFYKL